MIAELFSMLSTLDITKVNGKARLSVNMNRKRIRSISAFSSNSIFYFKTIFVDQATPEEVAMVSRMLERSYASFVVACIGLMPFHRVKADDQAAIESYLQQFHQNLGISDGSGKVMTKLFSLADSLSESVSESDLAATRQFLMECWDKSRKNCSRYVNMVADHLRSVNEMYSVDPIDPVTRVFQESYLKRLDELDSWGFIGEATANMLDNFDELASLSDADIIKSMMSDPDYDDDDDPDEDEVLDDLLGKTTGEAITEGNVRGAVNSIIFSLESVSENKIKSCSSLATLAQLEARLNKLKNKYAKYLNRYKRKHKENQEKKSKSKLIIRFNGETISNPKAFMKQYGGYVKIINKRLKMVEDRRAELRKKKGLPSDTGKDATLGESAIGTLSDLDLQVIDHLLELADKQLNAPDSEVFLEKVVVTPADPSGTYRVDARTGAPAKGTSPAYPKTNSTYVDDQGAWDSGLKHNSTQDTVDTLVKLQQEINGLKASRDQALGNNAKIKQDTVALRRQYASMEKQFGRTNAQQLASLGIYASTQKELQAKIMELEKENQKLKGTASPDDSSDSSFSVDWNKSKPAGGINLGKVAANGQTNFQTFDNKIFTDMDMKKANDAIPTFAKATIGFVIDETEQVVNRDVLVGIKVNVDRIPALTMINDIYNCIINKRQFLKFVKWISGEEKSLADLLFGFKELRSDALGSRGAGRWSAAFRRRKRWKDMSVPYLMKSFTPNGTIVLTMNEVQYIRDEYGVDVMRPDHVKMLMDSSFLLGFVVLDQANEIVYVSYDGEEGNCQQYTYAMLERSDRDNERYLREIYRAFSR